MGRRILMAIGFVWSLAGGVPAQSHAVAAETAAAAAAADRPESKEAIVMAAKRCFEATHASYEVGAAPMDEVCHWSQVWSQAEYALADDEKGRIAALQGHAERTKQLYSKVKALHVSGVKGGEAAAFHAAQFYRSEAELALAAAAPDGAAAGAARAKAQAAMLKAAKKAYDATLASCQAGATPY